MVCSLKRYGNYDACSPVIFDQQYALMLLHKLPQQCQPRQIVFAAGIPGDGRCLFRSVVHGNCLRSGKPPPSEAHERELADELRAKVTDELIKRRADTEWFVEGDFDTYVMQMRLPRTWGGEPELLMSSHVLQVPITVHMLDKKTNCLKVIAEYGQEYGKENPVRVLYHGYGHYDTLQNRFGSLQFKRKSRW